MKKILVIKDWADTHFFFVECLKAEGFYTISAENGLVGLHLAKQHLPDLIICDIMMPELSGYGVLTSLRQDPATAIIPFIFVTGKVTKADLRKSMELGADDYLPKPCTLEELLAAIAAQLKKQTALQQWYTSRFQQASELPPTDTASIAAEQSIFPSVPQLSEAFDFIEANYHRPITVGEVAQAVGYSPTYFTTLVRQQTGKTLYRWIIERRMVEAHSLLLETNQTVEQIAIKVGYHYAVHFFRQFRQIHGITPQAWRSVHRS